MDENRLDCVEVEGTSIVNSVKDIMEWRKNCWKLEFLLTQEANDFDVGGRK